jgi:hypothetical protein
MQQPARTATRAGAAPLSSVACLGGVVELGAAVGRFLDEVTQRVSADEAECEGDLTDRAGPFLGLELESVGNAAALEEVEASAGETDPGPNLADLFKAPHPRLVSTRVTLSPPNWQMRSSTTWTACTPTRSESSANRARPSRTKVLLTLQPAGSTSTQGSWLADGTAWAIRIRKGVPGSPPASQNG